MSSYSPPGTKETGAPGDFTPRPLVPLGIPVVKTLPPLPTPQRKSVIGDTYTLTTHLVPAAWSRTTHDVPDPKLPTWSPDKQQWKASVMETVAEVLDTKEKQRHGKLAGPLSQKVLWNCLNRYVRKDSSRTRVGRGVTLLFAHANGFPKEIWEPVIRHLVALPSTVPIDEIWAWEAVNHGDAALINEGNLGGLYDWQDNTRDILNFLLHYLPETFSSTALPTHLTRRSNTSNIQNAPWSEGRTLIGVGHSFGGCTMSLAALEHPALFSTIVLVDPIIRPYPTMGQPFFSAGLRQNVLGAVQRRDHWATREDARAQFSKSPFFMAWDPEVLEVYLECGLCDDAHGGVRLKMPGIQEAVVFAETLVPYEMWELVEQLDKRIDLRWALPGIVRPEKSGVIQRLAWLRPANSSNIRIAGAGHLIAQEKPQALAIAQDICDLIERKYGARGAKL